MWHTCSPFCFDYFKLAPDSCALGCRQWLPMRVPSSRHACAQQRTMATRWSWALRCGSVGLGWVGGCGACVQAEVCDGCT
eukprot:792-Chlamydomonas_euryale.AAC.2